VKKMSNKPCPSCSQGILSEKKKRFLFSYNGQKYWIPDVKVEVCDTCGEEVIEAKEIKRMEKIAKEKFENQYTGRFFVKIDPVLHRKLVSVSEKNGRTLHQEIAIRLEKSFMVEM